MLLAVGRASLQQKEQKRSSSKSECAHSRRVAMVQTVSDLRAVSGSPPVRSLLCFLDSRFVDQAGTSRFLFVSVTPRCLQPWSLVGAATNTESGFTKRVEYLI
jgi:hypothetical protein